MYIMYVEVSKNQTTLLPICKLQLQRLLFLVCSCTMLYFDIIFWLWRENRKALAKIMAVYNDSVNICVWKSEMTVK
jgi:hypothetical protein